MRTKQLNKLTMYLAVKGICDGNPTVWQAVQAFADAYADFETHVVNIQTYAQNQEQDTSGITQDKHAARGTMCNAALPIAKAIHAYALKTKNNQIAMSVDFSLSDLMSGRGVTSRDNCQNICATANANLALLADYGVTAAKLTALTAAIAAYNGIISKPRDTRVQGKTLTGNIQTEFTAADDALTLMNDLLGQLDDAKFVSDFTNARIIVDTAASHESSTPETPPATPPKT
jgi:hypothetical protein